MTPDRRDLVKRVFAEASELPEEARAAFVARSLEHPEDRAEVELLLQWDEAGFLATPALLERGTEPAGARIGHYRILHELGHGGMGTVYLAERDDEMAGRQVAIKVIGADGGAQDLEYHFTREKLALIKLEHPNIVSILDAGSSDSSAYLVMEYVDGLPLDAHCREHQLDIRRKLKLFLKVCDAVAYAHRNLVIHRDLKPSNILVTRDGHPKLVDFGVSKILDGRGEETLVTGNRWRVTLRYASPEQIKGERLTTATDIYSLGVVLYELLTGASPFGDAEEPSSLVHAQLHRDPLAPRRRQPALSRDLEAVVLKALRKNPAARYGSVDELAADLRDFLQGRPVKAWRGNYAYVFSKYLRRHAVPLSGTMVILALAGVLALSWTRSRRAEEDAQTALAMAGHLSTGLDGGLPNQSRPEVVANTDTLAELLLREAGRRGLPLDTRRALLSRLVAVGEMLGHPTTSLNLGRTANAARALEGAAHGAAAVHREYPDDSQAGHLLAQSLRALGSVRIEQNNYPAAAALFRRALTVDSELLRREPGSPLALDDYADSLANIARLYFHSHEAASCLRYGKESLEYRRRAVAASRDNPGRYRKGLGQGLSTYCVDLVEFERYREALGVCSESNRVLGALTKHSRDRRVALRLLANNAEHEGRAWAGLGDLARSAERFGTAIRRLRATEDDVPLDTLSLRHLASCYSRLAIVQARRGQGQAARASAGEALRLAREASGVDPSNVRERLALEEIQARLEPVLKGQR